MRFVIHETWGFFSAAGGSNYAQKPGVSVAVHDSEHLYRTFGVFRSEDSGGARAARISLARDKAEALAAHLEAEYGDHEA